MVNSRIGSIFTSLVIVIFLGLSPLVCLADDLGPAYSGSWRSRSGSASGTFSVHLKNREGILEGDIMIEGSPLTEGGRIQGTFAGKTITFGLVDSGYVRWQYEGTLDGKKMQGTYTVADGRITDRGAWKAEAEAVPLPAVGSMAEGCPALDLSRGIKCIQRQTNQIYYFKGDKIRFESPARIPGIKTYDLQIGDSEFLRVVISADGILVQEQPVRQTFDQWYRKVITGFQTPENKPGASTFGATLCKCLDLPDQLFAVPR